MRTSYVVVGYVCMMILAVFRDNDQLFPNWVGHVLWIGTIFCFTKLAFPSETVEKNVAGKGRYLNSPIPSTATSVANPKEFSRSRCRQLYQSVRNWKRENPYKSWDHPGAAEVFDEFSAALDKHLDEFADEARELETNEWTRYANEIRRNRD